MKINERICESRQVYAAPDAQLVEFAVECGFAASIEEVVKEEEVEF
ncbi:MAG: hypothetical protein J6R13_04200 [Alistipes sp.]|nr:hypothetical protein [Alistipes sp.]